MNPMKAIKLVLTVAFALAVISGAYAELPLQTNYQGRFTNPQGAPLNGIKSVSIKIYDSAVDGSLLYSETIGPVTFGDDGIYGFQFGAPGAGTPAKISDVFAATINQWFEITIDGTAQPPRQRLLAAPYAHVAGRLTDGAVTSATISNGTITSEKLATAVLNSISEGKNPPSAADIQTALGYTPANPLNTVDGSGNGIRPETQSAFLNSLGLAASPTGKSLLNVTNGATGSFLKTTGSGIAWATLPPTGSANIVDYGAVSGQLCDQAITAAIAGAVASGHRTIFFPSGNWYINAPIQINFTQLKLVGQPGSVIRQTTANHAIELAGVNGAARDCRISGLTLYGIGWGVEHSGIKWSNGATYLGDTLILEDCELRQFGTAIDLGNVNKIYVRNVSSIQCRIGARLAATETSLFLDCRMVGRGFGPTEGSMPDSSCFNLSGDMFSCMVIGGEFCGTNVQRFADIARGRLEVYNANIENPFSSQSINCTTSASKRIGLVGCRISEVYQPYQYLISADCTDGLGVPVIMFQGCHGYNAINQNLVEIYGSKSSPYLSGDPVQVAFSTVQGGSVSERSRGLNYPDARTAVGTINLPTSGTGVTSMLYGTGNDASDRTPDTWATNPVMRYKNHYTDTVMKSSTLNDMLARVIRSSPFDCPSVGNIETDLLNKYDFNTRAKLESGYTFPAGSLASYGESLNIKGFGRYATNENNKSIKILLATVDGQTATMSFDSGSFSGQVWSVEIELIRGYSNGNVVKAVATLTSGSTQQILETQTAASTNDSIAVRITGTGTTNSDIILKSAKAVWTRAESKF